MGVMDRLMLSDDQWERIAPLIIDRPDQKGSTGRDNRMFVEGVPWTVATKRMVGVIVTLICREGSVSSNFR